MTDDSKDQKPIPTVSPKRRYQEQEAEEYLDTLGEGARREMLED